MWIGGIALSVWGYWVLVDKNLKYFKLEFLYLFKVEIKYSVKKPSNHKTFLLNKIDSIEYKIIYSII